MGVDNMESATPDDSELKDDLVEDTTSEDQTSPDSSSEATEDEQFDLLSVVRNAAEPEDEETEASSATTEDKSGESDGSATASDTPQTEQDDEDFSDVPFHNHPRFQKLIQQRNSFKEGAQQYQQVQEFLTENSVTADEAADALTLRALMKTDPQAAWDQLKPIAQQLLHDAGLALPEDLNQRVQQGELTKAAATEISRLRASQVTSQRNTEASRQQQAQQQQQQQVSAVRTAVGEWEMNTRGRDPDFEAKADDLQREILWLQNQEGRPSDPTGARAQLQKAYDAVNKRVSGAQKPKPSVRPVTGGRSAGSTGASKPESMLDIVRANRATG